MVEPRTRLPLPLLHPFGHQPGAGPSSSSSTHAGFWSKSRTSTYASYHSHPSNWEENYSSNYDDYQAYSFGKPADPETLARWKVSKREGNETSSSSSDDGHLRKKSRDITPRASVVSLDTSTGQPDTSSPRRSHPSQDQQINYYHRGSTSTGGSDSSSALEHHHPAEFEQLKEGTDIETRSRLSKYSYDTGYEASNDASSSSRESHRSWSPHNSFATSEAEAVSISSSRRSVNSAHTRSSALSSHSLSAASASTEQISISSSRRSSGSGSEMYVSISSLKFDGESKDQTSENPSVSASTTVTPFPASTPPPAARSTNRSDFDLSYITSGLALSANALSRISDAEDEAIALDFVRSGQESENRGVDHRRLLQRADARTRRNSAGRSRPVGWQDDSSESPFKVEAGASRTGSPKRTRERAGTIQPTPRTKTAAASPTTNLAALSSTEDDFRALDTAGVYLNSTNAVPLSSSLPSSSLSPSSSSLEPNTTTLVGSSLSNSATSASPLSSTHTHAPFTPIPKSQLFSGLGSLGIGGEPTLYSHSRSRSHSPQGPTSPVSPVSPGETIGPGFNGEEDEEKNNPSSESPGSTPSPRLSHAWAGGLSAEQELTSIPPLSKSISPVSHPQSEVPSTSAKPDSSQLLNSSASVKSSDSFAYDDSFARGLMTWGGKEYGVLRREWVVRRERPERGKEESRRRAGLDGESNAKTDGKKTGKGKGREDADKDKDKDQDSDNPSKSSSEAGMPVGTEEIWRNFLLGRFSITREDVFSRSSGVGKDVQGKGKGGDRDGDENGKLEVGEQGGSRANGDNGKDTAPVSEKGKASKGGSGIGGKPPQQRIIIKRLRDDLASPTQIGVASTSKQLTSISTIPEDADDFSQSSTPVQGVSSSLTSRGAISTASPPSSRRSQFDSQHPTILVHRHSKIAAFSISRQYRDRGGQSSHTSNSPNGPSSSTLSSSSRLHIIMLAPRDLQEAFTNAEATRKLPSVIDRHEAVRAAFSPGYTSGHAKGKGSKTDAVATGKEKDKPNKEAKRDKGIILSALKGGKNHTTERERSLIKSDGQIELGRPDGEESGPFGLRYIGRKVSPDRTSHRNVHNSVGTKSAPVYSATENYKREQDLAPESAQTLGIRLRLSSAESSQNPESSTSVSSKSSSILKRLLPWDTSSSTSNHSSSKNSFGVTSQSSSTRGTQSMNSDISAPHVPPRVTFPTREQQEAQRGVHQMEHSFERVGLLPSKEKKNGRTGINLHSGGSITSRLSLKKTPDVLSAIPTGAFFMLLPLWPAETDMYSQRQYPFEAPSIPLDSRQYLLVFYKALQAESSAKTASPTVDFKKIHISGFRAIARQVSYSELQGTGVRVPEQGISVNGPLEDAFKQMPRSFAALPNSSFDGDSTAQLSVIGASYSRDAGIEFDPEALIELDLCTVLSADRKSLPPGMVTEQFDSEQSMTVKLTPIGSAVMEMIWAGGLALSSFSN